VEIRNLNIEIPASGEATLRRQAKRIDCLKNRILRIGACFACLRVGGNFVLRHSDFKSE
jgi:hypothetical protein